MAQEEATKFFALALQKFEAPNFLINSEFCDIIFLDNTEVCRKKYIYKKKLPTL